jgi:hypothetical protein
MRSKQTNRKKSRKSIIPTAVRQKKQTIQATSRKIIQIEKRLFKNRRTIHLIDKELEILSKIYHKNPVADDSKNTLKKYSKLINEKKKIENEEKNLLNHIETQAKSKK